MLVKLLVIAVFIVLVLYVVLPKRRVPAAPPRAGRLALSLLASAAVLLFILALFCALLWLGGVAGVVTGGGEVLGGTGLLRIAGLLLVLSIACGLAVLYKLRR